MTLCICLSLSRPCCSLFYIRWRALSVVVIVVQTNQALARVGGSQSQVQGHVKTQLIAHDKEVYDIAFSRAGGGRDMFASVGQSVTLVYIWHCRVLPLDSKLLWCQHKGTSVSAGRSPVVDEHKGTSVSAGRSPVVDEQRMSWSQAIGWVSTLSTFQCSDTVGYVTEPPPPFK